MPWNWPQKTENIFDAAGEIHKERYAQGIIYKLTTKGAPADSDQVLNKEKGSLSEADQREKEARREYMNLMKKIRGKPNVQIMEELEDDLEQLANIFEKIQEGKRRKILDSAASSLPPEPADLSAARNSQGVSNYVSTKEPLNERSVRRDKLSSNNENWKKVLDNAPS